MGLNFKKFSHLRICGSFDWGGGGGGVETEMTIGCFAGEKWEYIVSKRQCLNQRIFYFIEQREAIVRCLRSHGKYQHTQHFCIERKKAYQCH